MSLILFITAPIHICEICWFCVCVCVPHVQLNENDETLRERVVHKEQPMLLVQCHGIYIVCNDGTIWNSACFGALFIQSEMIYSYRMQWNSHNADNVYVNLYAINQRPSQICYGSCVRM